MTNYEHYKTDDEFLKNVFAGGFGVTTDEEKIVGCGDVECSSCIFNRFGNCTELRKTWLNEEYSEQDTVDWSKVKIDTPILVRDSSLENWKTRYFAALINGVVYTFLGGSNSYTTKSVTHWNYAKLKEKNNDSKN